MKIIEAEFALRPDGNKKTGTDSDGEPGDIEYHGHFIPGYVPPDAGEVF
jgi:hypothetical protein